MKSSGIRVILYDIDALMIQAWWVRRHSTVEQAIKQNKKALLYANGIAVWDVISQCEAGGALDSTIRNPVYNVALPEFVARRGISKVFFNGNNAYYFYRRGIGDIEKNALPSTSPAYAAMRLSEKLRLWREALTGDED